jgi:antitoxin HicB
MTPQTYRAYVNEAEPGAFLVQFYDIPEAITQGDTEAEAMANAADALDAALEGYLELGRNIPDPAQVSEARPGFKVFEVPIAPAIAARIALDHAMQAQGLSKVGLAQRMNRDEKVVRRIVSGRGASLDLTLEALRAVGIRAALAL